MGRKKKVVEQEQTNVEIKNNPKYNGSVNIRLVRNGKTIQNITKHNEGNTPLFSFLINCLNGTLNEEGIPHYINLGRMDGSDYKSLTTYKLHSTSSFVSKATVNDVEYPTMNFQFTIPTLVLNVGSNVGEVVIDAMRLYNSTNVKNQNEDGDMT